MCSPAVMLPLGLTSRAHSSSATLGRITCAAMEDLPIQPWKICALRGYAHLESIRA